MNIGDKLEVTLTGFAHDGRTVARAEGQPVVFTQGGLPGQRVLVELTAVKKRMAEGVTLDVLAPVPPSLGGERPAPCPHAAECGGCPWQALPYPEQLRWKRQLVFDALKRVGKLDISEDLIRPTLASPALSAARRASDNENKTANGNNSSLPLTAEWGEWGYRNKMEFAFAPADSSTSGASSASGGVRLGLRRRSSRDVVDVTGCLLQTPRTMAVLAALRDLVRKAGLSAWDENTHNGALRFAVIREPALASAATDSGQNSASQTMERPCLVEIITGPAEAEAFRKIKDISRALLAGPWGVTGFVHSMRTSAADVAYGEKTVFVDGDASLSETLRLADRDVTFALGHNAFFQVNTAATELLYNTADDLIRSTAEPNDAWDNCWDVYCGVGGLSLTLAPRFGRVLGLENAPAAVALARRNAASYPHCRFETTDAARLGEYFRRFGTPDLLVADPPRAGMDERAVQAVLTARPARLLLVSCNPATLARDLAALTTAYRLIAVQPVDLFPQTPHVETIAVLRRA